LIWDLGLWLTIYVSVEDDELKVYLEEHKTKMDKVGVINVEFWRLGARPFPRYALPAYLETIETVHETALKGNSKCHTIA